MSADRCDLRAVAGDGDERRDGPQFARDCQAALSGSELRVHMKVNNVTFGRNVPNVDIDVSMPPVSDSNPG
ncbi:hypothetical protein [Streptomyces sp. NBC_00154]|uniref:hypothetical protein n=1 Tax=Streptomyces sp. NBC_00154 TaxID=2975670 RepID=UPI002254DEF4|nr:hypothetical protein [Streptomyces sp. NBC_00154]MCX5309564.1 hypothetical protein [Streptomyces sp. NBC_00154]